MQGARGTALHQSGLRAKRLHGLGRRPALPGCQPGDKKHRCCRDQRCYVTYAARPPDRNGEPADDRPKTDAGVCARVVQGPGQSLCMRCCLHHADRTDGMQLRGGDAPYRSHRAWSWRLPRCRVVQQMAVRAHDRRPRRPRSRAGLLQRATGGHPGLASLDGAAAGPPRVMRKTPTAIKAPPASNPEGAASPIKKMATGTPTSAPTAPSRLT